MPNLYSLTEEPLPDTLHGSEGKVAIRRLSDWERVSIEDHFFVKGIKLSLSDKTTAIIISQPQAGVGLSELAVLIEFALGVTTISGFQSIAIAASFNSSKCIDGLKRVSVKAGTAQYPQKLTGNQLSLWISHLMETQRKTKGTIHIAADRYVRFLRADDSRDGLVDLCICLESLIESQTEISFRFSICLAKVCGLENPSEIGSLLSDLYDFRSKVVHGLDSTKQHNKLEPKLTQLRFAARAILSSYILFLAQHSMGDWKEHLRKSPFA